MVQSVWMVFRLKADRTNRVILRVLSNIRVVDMMLKACYNLMAPISDSQVLLGIAGAGGCYDLLSSPHH